MEQKFEVDKLSVFRYRTREDMGTNAGYMAAKAIREALDKKETLNIVFAAAPSQNEFLHSLCKNTDIEWARINAFHMDEYVGLVNGQTGSFSGFLANAIFDKVPLKSVNYINGGAADVEQECARYTALLAEHDIDFVFMGVGENGHIAFNDPGVADFNDKAVIKVVKLDLVCRMQQVHDNCFPKLEDVPTMAYTLSIPTLMSAKTVFCIVPGSSKAQAVRRLLNNDITTACPASVLRTHANAKLFLDAESSEQAFIDLQ
ncbi:MAG: glucosamine-6-phosphate deaminase [Oscillospiraceae bacterium]